MSDSTPMTIMTIFNDLRFVLVGQSNEKQYVTVAIAIMFKIKSNIDAMDIAQDVTKIEHMNSSYVRLIAF